MLRGMHAPGALRAKPSSCAAEILFVRLRPHPGGISGRPQSGGGGFRRFSLGHCSLPLSVADGVRVAPGFGLRPSLIAGHPSDLNRCTPSGRQAIIILAPLLVLGPPTSSAAKTDGIRFGESKAPGQGAA